MPQNLENCLNLTTSFENLWKTLKALLDPEKGCPWDLKQTHESLLPYFFEELYEFSHALYAHKNQRNDSGQNDKSEMIEELGDCLLQILLHAGIAEKEQSFSFQDVLERLNEKLIYRHPHVFGEASSSFLDQGPLSIETITQNWQILKKKEKEEEKEKKNKNKKASSSDFTPLENLPKNSSLETAYAIGLETGKIRFDWNNAEEVMLKVEEELEEVKEAFSLPSFQKEKIGEEIGDLFFSLVQLSRHLKLNPDYLLTKANEKFIRRFSLMTKLIENAKVDISTLTQIEMDVFWNQVKKQEQK